MPQGPFGGPRPLARCSLGIQVTASDDYAFTEDDVTEDILQLDGRFRNARKGGKSSAVVTVENGDVIANGSAARFRISPSVMNREQLETSLDVVESYFGQRVKTVAISLAD